MKTFKLFILFVVLNQFIACSSKNYKGVITQNKIRNNIACSGSVVDGQDGSIVSWAAIKIEDSIYKADKNGNFQFVLEPGSYSITAIYVGLEVNSTKNFRLVRGDSLNLDFFMKPDPTPLH